MYPHIIVWLYSYMVCIEIEVYVLLHPYGTLLQFPLNLSVGEARPGTYKYLGRLHAYERHAHVANQPDSIRMPHRRTSTRATDSKPARYAFRDTGVPLQRLFVLTIHMEPLYKPHTPGRQ